MISQGEVERKYKKLMHDVATNEFYKIDLTNRVNCYKCGCGHITKTIDIDAGVTPGFFSCGKCGEMAGTTFFKDVVPGQSPTVEWYRPTLQELFKMRNKPSLLEHIFSGGLHYRKI